MAEKTLYRLNDDISFRKCSLFDDDQLTFGDCTNFHKPEKGQLTSDHKDMDPAKVLSKIEVKFKGRKLTQEYTE